MAAASAFLKRYVLPALFAGSLVGVSLAAALPALFIWKELFA